MPPDQSDTGQGETRSFSAVLKKETRSTYRASALERTQVVTRTCHPNALRFDFTGLQVQSPGEALDALYDKYSDKVYGARIVPKTRMIEASLKDDVNLTQVI